MDEYEQHLIAALVSEPQSIRERLSPEDREQLDVLLDLVAEGGSAERLRGIARAVADISARLVKSSSRPPMTSGPARTASLSSTRTPTASSARRASSVLRQWS